MPATDLTQAVREAVRAIWLADADVQAVGGAVPRVVDRWLRISRPTLPLIAYEVVTVDEGSLRAQVRITAVADAPNAEHTANHLAQAAADALTYGTLQAQGVDAVRLENVLAESVIDVGVVNEIMEFGEAQRPKQADRLVTLQLFD